jgi:hypothetical protein
MNTIPAPSPGSKPGWPGFTIGTPRLIFRTALDTMAAAMKQRFSHRPVRDVLERLKRFFKREPVAR